MMFGCVCFKVVLSREKHVMKCAGTEGHTWDGEERQRTQAVLESVSTSSAESQTQNAAFRYVFDVFKVPELDLGALRCDRFVVNPSPLYRP